VRTVPGYPDADRARIPVLPCPDIRVQVLLESGVVAWIYKSEPPAVLARMRGKGSEKPNLLPKSLLAANSNWHNTLAVMVGSTMPSPNDSPKPRRPVRDRDDDAFNKRLDELIAEQERKKERDAWQNNLK
jgi:hypothetical protein